MPSEYPSSASAAVKLDQLSEHGIRLLVDAFYARVRRDAELGPIFENSIAGDWDAHLSRMRDFWSSLMLASGRYKGNPLAAHLSVESISPALFPRWLELFDASCKELFVEQVAEAFMVKAARVAENLQYALFYRRNLPWPRKPT